MYGGVIKADEICGGEAILCELGADEDQKDIKEEDEKDEEETVTEEEAPQQEPAEE